VTVATAVLRPTSHWVWVGQLHQVDHLWADPKPGAAVREAVVRAIRVEL
jgi:hypothetical protein